MKRFASHYLFLPDTGFIKQQVVEVTDDGTVQNVFPLTEEVESVEWMPGVIVLISSCPSERSEESILLYCKEEIFRFALNSNGDEEQIVASKSFTSSSIGSSIVSSIGSSSSFSQQSKLFPVLLYPFDFTSMQPVAETRHRLLR